MSATNKTTYYDLPLFIGTDIPSWLGDWNNTMTELDSCINGVNTKSESASATAGAALNKSDQNTVLITNQQAQIKALQEVTSNYAEILTFQSVLGINSPTNLTSGSVYVTYNPSKTLFNIKGEVLGKNGPTVVPTSNIPNRDSFVDIITYEDNLFNLTASTLPNETSLNAAWVPFVITSSQNAFNGGTNLYIWFDGATTHIGLVFTGSKIDNFGNVFVPINTTIFKSGSVFTPAEPLNL